MTPPGQALKTARGTWTLGLFDPGMTDLHRTGLAGLAMTLAAWDRQGKTIPGGTWHVGRDTVRLDWEDEAFLKAIVQEGLAIGDDGLIAFPGLGPDVSRSQRTTLHNGLLATFLQHPQARTLDAATVDVTETIDDEVAILRYRPLREMKTHRVMGKTVLIPLELSITLFPGAGQRHGALASSALKETPERSFLLRFAPVGAIYYRAGARHGGATLEWCVVLPHIIDLQAYTGARLILGTDPARDLQVAGTGEAALHFLAHQAARQDARALGVAGCTVIGFGQRVWNAQQQIRVSRVRTGEMPLPILRTYLTIRGHAPPRLISWTDRKTGRPGTLWVVAPILELVASNLLAAKPIWTGFAAWWQDIRDAAQSSQRDWVLRDNREAIRAMTSELNGPEAILVHACHEAWRRRAGALAEQKGDFTTRYRNKFEETRIAFSRCKTPDMFRATITDFWVRAGSLPALRDHWQEILPFLGPRWQEGRDLALLALASYQGQGSDVATEDAGIDNPTVEDMDA